MMKQLLLLVAVAALVNCEESQHKLQVLIKQSHHEKAGSYPMFNDVYKTLLVSVKQGYEATAKAITAARMHALPAIISSQKLISETMEAIGVSIVGLIKKDEELKAAIIASVDVWPAGSYCILAAGKCPSGFCRKEGHLHAIKQYAFGQDKFLKPVKFGSSSVKHHDFNQLADIDIAACCKGAIGCAVEKVEKLKKTEKKVEKKTEKKVEKKTEKKVEKKSEKKSEE